MINSKYSNQSGSVSLFVSLAVLMILGLISLSFFSLMSDSHTKAHQRRLHSQAQLSAESALNDARADIYATINAKMTQTQKLGQDLLNNPFVHQVLHGCNTVSTSSANYRSNLDAEGSAAYTCVNIVSGVKDIVYDRISVDKSRIAIIQTREDTSVDKKQNIDQLTIEWDAAPAQNSGLNNSKSFDGSSSNEFPESWGYDAPVLRVELVPLNLKKSFTRSDLNDNTRVFFLYPKYKNTASSITAHKKFNFWGASGLLNSKDVSGKIIPVNCNPGSGSAMPCKVTIKNFNRLIRQAPPSLMPQPPGTGEAGFNNHSPTPSHPTNQNYNELVYIARIRPIYSDAKVRLSGAKSSLDSNNETKNLVFINDQVLVKVTGIAGSNKYRFEERIAVFPDYDRPEYAIDTSTSICKLLTGNKDSGLEINPDFATGVTAPDKIADLYLPDACTIP